MKVDDFIVAVQAGTLRSPWVKLIQCDQCGVQEIFIGENPTDCRRNAKRGGWKPQWPTDTIGGLCPCCSGAIVKQPHR